MRRAVRIAVITALAATAAGAAGAGEPRRHDGGFFLRMAPGFGHSSTEADDAGVNFALEGASGSFDIAIGGMVKENFAIHGTLGGWGIEEPDVEFGGFEEEADDTSISLGSIGAGVTWYFGPNMYLTGSVGAATLYLEVDGDDEDSDTGVTLDVGLGKEWWVSDRWGLGLSGTLGYHSIPPDNASSNFTGTSFAIRFSATFN